MFIKLISDQLIEVMEWDEVVVCFKQVDMYGLVSLEFIDVVVVVLYLFLRDLDWNFLEDLDWFVCDMKDFCGFFQCIIINGKVVDWWDLFLVYEDGVYCVYYKVIILYEIMMYKCWFL